MKIAIEELLTDAECKRVWKLYHECDGGTFARRCADEILSPIMQRINAVTRQKNDPLFVAYALEYALAMETKKPPPSFPSGG
jgi:hypothetical protein